MVKTFRGPDMLTTLKSVMRDLGPDAMVLSVRSVKDGPNWQVWQKPVFEIIAAPAGTILPKDATGSSAEDAGSATAASAGATVAAAGASDVDTSLSIDLENLVRQLTRPEAIPAEKTPSGKTITPFQPPQIRLRSQALEEPVPTVTSAAAKEIETPSKAAYEPPAFIQAVSGSPSARETELPRNVEHIRRQILSHGVSAVLTEKLISITRQSLSPSSLADLERVRAFVAQQLTAVLHQPPSEKSVYQKHVFAMVGLSGSGKTSACARMAARAALQSGKRTAWICADTHHTGAVDKARAYTRALGIELTVVYSSGELGEALEAHKDQDMVLVDLPGLNLRSRTQMAELSAYLSVLPLRSAVLVSPATAKETDLEQVFLAVKPFGFQFMIATKMDETCTFGSLLNVSWRSKLPIVFTSDGPDIIENFHLADPAGLAAAILNEEVIL